MISNQRYDRFELKPKYDEQAKEIWGVYDLAYKQGGWCIYNDEEWYIEEELGLTRKVNMLLTQGRSLKITLVMGAQRPARISRFVLSQAIHVLSFGVEGRDAKLLAEATSPKILNVVANLNLSEHEFVWWNRKTRDYWTGNLQAIGGRA